MIKAFRDMNHVAKKTNQLFKLLYKIQNGQQQNPNLVQRKDFCNKWACKTSENFS